MKKIILLLCLGLIGCATVATPPRMIKKPIVANEKEMDNVIFVFSEAIKKNPKSSGAYYNRAVAYFYKKDYKHCWQDVQVAESLGCKFSADFLNALEKASLREE